ncbi:MAG: transcription-repair coupling factor [Peptococcaceae bacterium]|nr:transcription-repair coupling factor [Peptococcaceae bacterium]
MRGLLAPIKKMNEFKNICLGLDRGTKQQLVFGLSGSQKAYVAAALLDYRGGPAIILVPGEQEASNMVDDLLTLLPGKRVLHFPVRQLLPYQILAAGWEAVSARLKVLEALAGREPVVVVATPEAFIRRLTPPEIFRSNTITLAVGDVSDPGKLIKQLAAMGYERSEMVEGHGQFSVRGGILDIFPMTLDSPVRLEFFDDEIDSIRAFDADTQRSTGKLQRITVSPATELIVDEQARAGALQKIESEFKAQLKRITKTGTLEARRSLAETYGAAVEKIRSGLYFPEMDHFLPYFYPEPVTLADYFPPGALALVDEPVRWKEVIEVIHKERSETYTGLLAQGKVLPGQYGGYIQWDDAQRALDRFATVFLSFLPRQPQHVSPGRLVTFPAKGMHAFLGRMDILTDEVAGWKRSGYAVALLAGSRDQARQLLNVMRDAKIDAYYAESLDGDIGPGNVVITGGSLTGGFELPTVRLAVVTGAEMYGRQRKVKARAGFRARMEPVTDLRAGDYVVHINHGIGRYLGIEKLEIGGIQKDYLTIKYAGEDKLYVPTDQVGMIQKYLGGEADAPKLSRLGGAEWNRVKGRVRESVREMAKELLALYAARESTPGHAFGPDTVWQKEFEEAFPYEETPDQLRAAEEVKRDMERSRPMDRLLCGDVGYGKTEVALRAAFKAVMDGKQVAVLVPTTILAQQHHNTFRERFAPYPISIEMLSRFRSPREQKKILRDLAQGKLDIVIGTHRLVQEDVAFKNLGLVVVDEEQRFGVAHKERLKMIKQNVDVLTLTATPIPRTLHMSLVGVRDTSLLETPPENRFPVQTYVLEEDPSLIREAIYREMGRGGQVFFVHNRIQDLDGLAGWIQGLVPDARLAVAHGQMREDDLEKIMMDFIDGDYDVLICTTIIESGLDIPNVNTLIVKDANNMGLSQLYQLRGRVGRSSRIAYAYFTYRRDRILSEVAEKRLAAIKEFTAFGSGYKIALRDLEIRGAGNLLGPEQHGHIDAVGFDLYCRLLEEAVREARGEEKSGPVDTAVELPVEAYIPETYVPDPNQKVEIYRRLAALSEVSALDDLAEELEDRFGDAPLPVRRLLRVARIRTLAGRIRIKNISEQSGFFKLQFAPGHPLTGEKLVKISKEYRNRVKFANLGEEFEIRLRAPGAEENPEYYLEELEGFIGELAG